MFPLRPRQTGGFGTRLGGRVLDGGGCAAQEGCDVLLHGHTHRRTLETRDGSLLFNPGECAGHLAGHQTVGVVDLGTLEAELLHF